MTAATRISSCVDCATPIIGECLRCPSCHEQHASRLVAPYVPDASLAGAADDDAKAYIARDITALARWGVAIEVIVIVVLALILLVRGCA